MRPMLKLALAACCGLLALTMTPYGQPAFAAGQPSAALPSRQVTFAVDGVHISLGTLVVNQSAAAATLIIENDRSSPVHFAALSGRSASGVSQVVLSDEAGSACMAEAAPVGVAEIEHLSRAPKPPIAALTTIPPRSRMSAAFRFRPCRLANTPLSLAGEFALSTNGQDVKLITVPFWGIVPKRAAR